MPRLKTGLTAAKSGLVEVDIRVTALSPGILARLRAVGAQLRHASAKARSIRAGVPEAALERIAGWRDVLHVAPAMGFITARETLPGSATRTGKAARVKLVREALEAAQPRRARVRWSPKGTRRMPPTSHARPAM